MRAGRWLFAAFVGLTAGSRAADRQAEIWEKASKYYFYEARTEANALPSPTREDRLARAVLLFSMHPIAPAQFDQAQAELDALIAENSDDAPGLAARFFLGRLAQLHRRPTDLALARRHFETLVGKNPHFPLSEQAQVKLALMDLYPVTRQRPERTIFEHWDSVARELVTADARRDLHIALGRALLYYRADLAKSGFDVRRPALDHLTAANESGAVSFKTRAELLVAMGELANELGLSLRARAAYSAFVEEYSRDVRAGTIRLRLAGLPKESAP